MKRVVLGAVGFVALVVLLSCGRAVHGYFAGTAVIMFSGYPGRSGWNLDPGTRVPFRSQGCRVIFFEPLLVHLPNNLTVDLLAATFGPMRGTYHGPYPTPQEAAAALRDGPALYPRLVGNEWPPGIDCEGVRAKLQEESPEPPPPIGFATMRCGLFKDETLVLGNAQELRLFDRKTGRRYALFFQTLPSELVLEGFWEGSEEVQLESGATQSTQFLVTFEGGAGTYTYHQEQNTPLLAVRQQENALEFEVESRGKIQHYAGAWDGHNITGTVGRRRFRLWPNL